MTTADLTTTDLDIAFRIPNFEGEGGTEEVYLHDGLLYRTTFRGTEKVLVACDEPRYQINFDHTGAPYGDITFADDTTREPWFIFRADEYDEARSALVAEASRRNVPEASTAMPPVIEVVVPEALTLTIPRGETAETVEARREYHAAAYLLGEDEYDGEEERASLEEEMAEARDVLEAAGVPLAEDAGRPRVYPERRPR